MTKMTRTVFIPFLSENPLRAEASSTHPNLIWSDPASSEHTVHLASLKLLFFSSVASTAPFWESSFCRHSSALLCCKLRGDERGLWKAHFFATPLQTCSLIMFSSGIWRPHITITQDINGIKCHWLIKNNVAHYAVIKLCCMSECFIPGLLSLIIFWWV